MATAQPAAPARPPRPEWWLLDRLALTVAALAALCLYALIGRGGWYVDDFLNFGLARRYPLSWHYLGLVIFQHPQPATRLADWLLYRASPMNYSLDIALPCLGIGLATWLVYRILRLAFRPSPWHLVLTAMAGITGLWVPAIAWWAGGLEIVGCVLADLLMVHALLRCYRGRHRVWWGLLAGCWLLIGLTWYERALFGAAFAAWFVPAVSCRSPRQLLTVLRRAWPGYLTLTLVTLGYLRFYLTHDFVTRQYGYSWAELLHFFWVCWSHAMIPGLFGGSLGSQHLDVLSFAHPPLWWLTGCQLALLVLVGYGLFRSRWRAALAWLAFVVVFLAAQYTIASARLYVHHTRIGQEYRYLADLLPLLVLTVGISVLRPAALLAAARPYPAADQAIVVAPAAAEGPGDVHASEVHAADDADVPGAADTPAGRWRRRRRLLATGVALAALATVYLVSSWPVSERWVHSRHVWYVRNLRASVAELDRRGPWSLYTTYTPWDVTPFGYDHYSQTTEVARLLTGRPVNADDLTKPMYVATVDGQLKPARLQPLATVADVCSRKQQKFMLALSRPLPRGLWNLQLHYRVAAPTFLRFALDPGTRVPIEATGSFRSFAVHGSGELTFAIRYTAISALRIDLAAAGSCVSDVRIGVPVPTG